MRRRRQAAARRRRARAALRAAAARRSTRARARVERGRLDDRGPRRTPGRSAEAAAHGSPARCAPVSRSGARLDAAGAVLRALARRVDVRPGGERDAHPALLVRLRLAEQAQVGPGHRQRVGDAVEADAPRLDAAVDDRRRAGRRAAPTSTGSPRIARAWRSNSFCACVHIVTIPVSCGRGLTSENQTSSPLTKSSTPKMPRPPRLAVTLLRDVARASSAASADIGCGCHDST